jgi:prepilin-type N-terminal cleavage/methylation domain-containing protein
MKKNTGKIKKFLSPRKGFSLVEVLLSLMVLSIGISGITILMTTNIKNTIVAKNQIIASSLAQEGIELVRNLKDSRDVSMDVFVAGPAYIDKSIDNTGLNMNSAAAKRLYQKNGLYSHDSSGTATATKFYRKVEFVVTGIAGPPSTRVITVTSYVTWKSGGTFAGTCNIANECVSVISVLQDL